MEDELRSLSRLVALLLVVQSMALILQVVL